MFSIVKNCKHFKIGELFSIPIEKANTDYFSLFKSLLYSLFFISFKTPNQIFKKSIFQFLSDLNKVYSKMKSDEFLIILLSVVHLGFTVILRENKIGPSQTNLIFSKELF